MKECDEGGDSRMLEISQDPRDISPLLLCGQTAYEHGADAGSEMLPCRCCLAGLPKRPAPHHPPINQEVIFH